ncbi:MAG: DUF3147 family protein [Verrucomicrobia bacterium]|nr:DUF3147 family protein [Verrucomicrobiota bacterium]
MTFLLFKYLTTALVVVVVSELARRSDRLGALIASLPLVTVIVMIWLYAEHQGSAKIANHAYYTFWYVIPTLPMFLLMSKLMSRNVNFWLSLLLCSLLTIACFVLVAIIAKRFGVNLVP